MTTTPLQLITDALPLTVGGVEVDDPVLTVYGDDWSLTVMCPWTLRGSDTATSWESNEVEDEAWELVGRRIESVSARDSDATEPAFHFAGGLVLEVHADTDLDPWTLTLPGHVVNGKLPDES